MQKNFLILFFILCSPLSLLADSSFQARVAGLGNLNNLFPVTNNTPQPPKHLFNISLPGFGRIRIKLNRNRDFQTLATYTDLNRTKRAEEIKYRLFRGKVSTKSKEHPLAASMIYLKHTPYLILSFSALNPHNRKTGFYKIKINLTSPIINSARAYRFTKYEQNAFHNDQLLEAPIRTNLQFASPRTNQVYSPAKQYQTIALHIDADSYWYKIYGEDSNSVISSFLNEAEVIYENDLGLNFHIVKQNVFTEQSFGIDNAVDRLCNYQYYTTGESSLTNSGCELTAPQGPQDYYGEANAYHLFTGQELNTSTIGLAFVGTVCTTPSYAFALTQLTSVATTPITFAHELAHNLSAIHDDSTGSNGIDLTSCPETEIPNIMNAYLSYDPPENFSECSRNLVADHLDKFGSCLNKPLNTLDTPSVNEPLIKTLSLKLKFQQSGNLIGELTLPAAKQLSTTNSCQLEVVVAKKFKNLASSPHRTRLQVSDSGSQLRFANKLGIKEDRFGKRPPIFFKSYLYCEEELISESKTVRVSTENIQSDQEQGINQMIARIPDQLILF